MLDILQMDEELSDQGMETELDPTQLLEVSICLDKGYQIVQQRMILIFVRTGPQNSFPVLWTVSYFYLKNCFVLSL
jgi:hypothetical protein